jgi:hypothetical protein
MTENIQQFDTTQERIEGVATTKLTTAKELLQHQRQHQRFRACLHTAVLHRARGKVKDQIRAENRKVHHYSAGEISAMAEELLKKPGERERMIADCEGWVRELIFKAKR